MQIGTTTKSRPKKRDSLTITGFVLKPMYVTLKQTLKATFGRPNTVLYPYERLKLPKIYRGMNQVIWEKCISCQLCARVCPNKCIVMVDIDDKDLKLDDLETFGPHRSIHDEKKGKIKRPSINFGRCMFCGFCEEYCPTGAMIMTDYFELAVCTREGLLYSAQELRVKEENAKGYKPKAKAKEKAPLLVLKNKIQEYPVVDPDKCTGCRLCERNCPTRCITMVDGPKMKRDKTIQNPKYDESACVGCGTCVEDCKFKALRMEV